MNYKDFEKTISAPRMSRYKISCNGNTRKAMTLYRLNLRLSQELFTIVGCFEIALRNAIDHHYSKEHGIDWLKNAAGPTGMFNSRICGKTPYIIAEAARRLTNYSHPKLIAEMDFGFWRYLFAKHQFRIAGQSLLKIFPSKPKSSKQHNYNDKFIFDELEKINNLRNRIAHHEPVCFELGTAIKNTQYSRDHYQLIIQLFQWMDIDHSSLLYGLDHVIKVCNKINSL